MTSLQKKNRGHESVTICDRMTGDLVHQEFQVPKMEVLNLIRLFLGLGFPLHKPYPYSLYR